MENCTVLTLKHYFLNNQRVGLNDMDDGKPVPTIFFLEGGTFIDLFNKWDSLFREQRQLKYDWNIDLKLSVNSCWEDKQIKLQIYDIN